MPTDIWRVVQRRLKAIDVAARLDDLKIPAGNRLEALKTPPATVFFPIVAGKGGQVTFARAFSWKRGRFEEPVGRYRAQLAR